MKLNIHLHLVPKSRMMELYLLSHIRLHDLVLTSKTSSILSPEMNLQSAIHGLSDPGVLDIFAITLHGVERESGVSVSHARWTSPVDWFQVLIRFRSDAGSSCCFLLLRGQSSAKANNNLSCLLATHREYPTLLQRLSTLIVHCRYTKYCCILSAVKIRTYKIIILPMVLEQ
jgi:hypothetical protein